MATCTNYFFAEDQDGNALSENIRASIYKYTADGWTLVGDAWIAPRSGDHLTLTENNSYKAVPITDISGYTTPNEQVWTACSKDITFVYKRICPNPTVSITDVSNRNPESGEVVNFTGYASGGTGHSIVSRKWDFGDGTSSTLSNPSKSWKNTTGSPKIYTVRFTATNDCGNSRSTSTTVTVASEVVKTGIEIQFPSSLNGKQLIAHGAISTVLGMWWTGPAVHGGLWTKGRCTWDNIDSSKKYVIQTGDACETSLPRELPEVCAGTFANGDDVVILVRNPGFDFRVYGSGNVHTLSGTSFNVLYLDETSGDIITTAFTGKVCGWLGIPSGTECDAFWAEFYDPIFVANYMSIRATGVDMFGNARTLSWIDHVAFVASLIGSLPVFNVFPFAGVVKNVLNAGSEVVKKTADLIGSNWDKAAENTALVFDNILEGFKTNRETLEDPEVFYAFTSFVRDTAMWIVQEGAKFEEPLSVTYGRMMAVARGVRDAIKEVPEVIRAMAEEEVYTVRQAMIRAFGDIDGNKIIDDALGLSPFFKEFTEKLSAVLRAGGRLTSEEVGEMLAKASNPATIDEYYEVLGDVSGGDPAVSAALSTTLRRFGGHEEILGDVIDSHARYFDIVPDGTVAEFSAFVADNASLGLKSLDNIVAWHVPQAAQDFVVDAEFVEELIGNDIGEELAHSAKRFLPVSVDQWWDEGTSFVTSKLGDYWSGVKLLPAGESGPRMLKPWETVPSTLPATVGEIVNFKPILDDVPTLERFADVVDDAAKATPSLTGSKLTSAGKALRSVCVDTPEVVQKMDATEVANLRSALVKAYGTIDGNKYVDDALAAIAVFVRKYHDILERFRTGAIGDVPVETINEILDHGKTTPDDILDLMDSFSPNELRGLISKLQDGTHKHPTGMMFESIGTYRGSVSPGNIPKYVTDSCDIASEAMKAPSPAAAADIPKTAQDFVFDSRPLAAEAGDTINDDLLESMREFAGQPHTAWKDKAISFVDRKIIRWFDKIKGAPKKKVKYDDHMSRFAKWKAIYADLEDWQKFTTMTMLAWGCYEVASFFGGYVIPKILGVFPEQASWRQIRHNENMESFAWMCKAAHDEGRTDDLKEAIGLLRNEIAEAEKHLADNATEFKISKVYNGFLNALEGAKLTLSIAEGWLVEMVPVGYIRCTSNEAFFYVDLDGSPAGFSYANKEILLSSVPVGNHVVKIHKSGSGECEKTITVGEGITSEFYCQLGIVCTPPVPSITAPGKAKVKEGVRFTGSATTESAITYWHWDFDDGTDSHVQSPSHLFWSAGTYTVKLTVTDDCGTAETTHTIVIEGEAPIPPIPPIIPPEEEAATIDVKTPIDARTGGAIVFPIKPYIFVDGKSIDETAPYPIPFGGFGELPVKDPTTVTVKAAGYQDKSETFHLTDKYFESWVPYMDPVGYVPPVGHPIDFYIPENASLTVTPITTVSRLVAGIRSIGRR